MSPEQKKKLLEAIDHLVNDVLEKPVVREGIVKLVEAVVGESIEGRPPQEEASTVLINSFYHDPKESKLKLQFMGLDVQFSDEIPMNEIHIKQKGSLLGKITDVGIDCMIQKSKEHNRFRTDAEMFWDLRRDGGTDK